MTGSYLASRSSRAIAGFFVAGVTGVVTGLILGDDPLTALLTAAPLGIGFAFGLYVLGDE